MAVERYVLLGLGTARTPWFTEVARWATVGSIPAEFVKCISAEELRVRLTSGRPFSAVLVDVTTGAVDRDLLDTAARHHTRVLVVDGSTGGPARDWRALGAAAVLPSDLRREQLLDALAEHCRMIGSPTEIPGGEADDPAPVDLTFGRLVAVTGAGGVGTSTVAMATAQALAGTGRRTVLADLCLDAELAMLHDARDVVPGVQELVDAHRSARPSRPEVHALTFDVVNRGYNLLLGLRRHRDWAVVKPRTFDAALSGLLDAFDVVVADVDDDLEGEAECGSIDVEERNVMARTATARAEVVVAVGGPGLKGLHGLVRTVNRLREHGVDATRILAVVNRAPRAARGRAELARSFAELVGARTGGPAPLGPLPLPERRGLDDLLRDGGRMPQALVDPLAGALGPVLDTASSLPTGPVAHRPVPVASGRIGAWAAEPMAPS